MSTLKIGIASLADFRDRTLAIARGEHRPAPDEPKVWFSSVESFAKVLSDRNRELLATIAATRPDSINDLALATGRAVSNLSRTLKTMERLGIVQFEKGAGRQRAPRVAFTEIVLNLPLTPESKAA